MSAAFAGSYYVLWFVRLRIVAAIAGLPVWGLLNIHVLPVIGAALMAATVRIAIAPFAGVSDIVLLVGVIYGAFSAVFMRDRLVFLAAFVAPSGQD